MSLPEELFAAITELVPREDRDLGGRVFAGFSADRLRTAIGRACKAAGVPHSRRTICDTAGSCWRRAGRVPTSGEAGDAFR